MSKTPILENDYLTPEVLAVSLSLAQPQPYAFGRHALRPTLAHGNVTVSTGKAWAGGTPVEFTSEERISVADEVPDGTKKIVALRVDTTEPENTGLRLLQYTRRPYEYGGDEYWRSIVGGYLDYPIAIVERVGGELRLTDVRVYVTGSVLYYMGEDDLSDLNPFVTGSMYVGRQGGLYIAGPDGGTRFMAPENPDTFRDVSDEVMAASSGLASAKIACAKSELERHYVGKLVAAYSVPTVEFKGLKYPQYTFIKIGYDEAQTPVGLFYIKGEWQMATLPGLAEVSGEISVDFRVLGF